MSPRSEDAVSHVDAPRAEPHLEPAVFDLREGESIRVDLVVGEARLPLVVRMKGGGQVEMALIDPDQAWFWTEEWQAAEREADEDLAAGRSEVYDDAKAFLDSFGA